LLFVRFLFVAGDRIPHRRQESEEWKKLSQIQPLSVFFMRRRVNPHAASGGGAWRRRTASVPKLFPRFVFL